MVERLGRNNIPKETKKYALRCGSGVVSGLLCGLEVLIEQME